MNNQSSIFFIVSSPIRSTVEAQVNVSIPSASSGIDPWSSRRSTWSIFMRPAATWVPWRRWLENGWKVAGSPGIPPGFGWDFGGFLGFLGWIFGSQICCFVGYTVRRVNLFCSAVVSISAFNLPNRGSGFNFVIPTVPDFSVVVFERISGDFILTCLIFQSVSC